MVLSLEQSCKQTFGEQPRFIRGTLVELKEFIGTTRGQGKQEACELCCISIQ